MGDCPEMREWSKRGKGKAHTTHLQPRPWGTDRRIRRYRVTLCAVGPPLSRQGNPIQVTLHALAREGVNIGSRAERNVARRNYPRSWQLQDLLLGRKPMDYTFGHQMVRYSRRGCAVGYALRPLPASEQVGFSVPPVSPISPIAIGPGSGCPDWSPPKAGWSAAPRTGDRGWPRRLHWARESQREMPYWRCPGAGHRFAFAASFQSGGLPKRSCDHWRPARTHSRVDVGHPRRDRFRSGILGPPVASAVVRDLRCDGSAHGIQHLRLGHTEIGRASCRE